MAYKRREVLLAEIEDLRKSVEQEKRERELHVADIERKCEYEVEDLKKVVRRLEASVGLCHADLREKDAVLRTTEKFADEYAGIIRLFAENSSPTIITESDFMDEGEIPQS